MFKISVKREFDAAHKLERHPGKCSRLHGHTWMVEVVFKGEMVGETGILLDFNQAGSLLDEVISCYDHAYINEIPPFDLTPPTAENMARIIFDRLTEVVRGSIQGVTLESVKVWESHDNWAMYLSD